MQERINEIIEFLIRELSQVSDPLGLNLDKISKALLKEGYTEREIHKAVEWVIMNLDEEHLPDAAKIRNAPLPSLRVLMAEELHFFTAEAHGYLIQLQILGIVDALQTEQIIKRCLLTGLNKIELEDLKTIVSQILLGKKIEKYNTDAIYHPGNDKLN